MNLGSGVQVSPEAWSRKMTNNIGRKLVDYFFAKDIYEAHKIYDNRIEEFVLDEKRLEQKLKGNKTDRVLDLIMCSALPNALNCVGIGMSLYTKNLFYAASYGVLGESLRVFSRNIASRNIRFYNKLMDESIAFSEMNEKIRDGIKELQKRLDGEGEEWKRSQ